MARAAYSLLKASGRILLEGTPEGIDLDQVRARLIAADPHVRDVHDVHAWLLASNMPAMSAHVVVDDDCVHDGHNARILDALQDAMAGEFDVEHSTLQFEMTGHAAHELGTH